MFIGRTSLIIIPIALAAALLSGCGSARISMDSTPSQAEIYVSPAASPSDAKRIGVTPLEINASDLSKQTGISGPVILEFRKDGYKPRRALVTDLSPVDLNLKVDLSVRSGLEDQDRMNVLIDRVFEAQRLALAGRYDDALAQLKDVEKDAPQMAAAYEIEAGIYYMQNKLPAALDSYRIASRYDPKDPETIRMRNYLEAKLGLVKTEAKQ